jgi:hypothetical protein
MPECPRGNGFFAEHTYVFAERDLENQSGIFVARSSHRLLEASCGCSYE